MVIKYTWYVFESRLFSNPLELYIILFVDIFSNWSKRHNELDNLTQGRL